jgi:hypothetical protein
VPGHAFQNASHLNAALLHQTMLFKMAAIWNWMHLYCIRSCFSKCQPLECISIVSGHASQNACHLNAPLFRQVTLFKMAAMWFKMPFWGMGFKMRISCGIHSNLSAPLSLSITGTGASKNTRFDLHGYPGSLRNSMGLMTVGFQWAASGYQWFGESSDSNGQAPLDSDGLFDDHFGC